MNKEIIELLKELQNMAYRSKQILMNGTNQINANRVSRIALEIYELYKKEYEDET